MTNSTGVRQYNDMVLGTNRSDTMVAESWQWQGVYMNGGGGDDWMYGTSFNDTLVEGAGNGRLYGGQGNDVLTGGTGSDKFVFAGGDGSDRITDLNWLDDIVFQNVNPATVMLVTTGNKMAGTTGYAIVYGEDWEQSTIQLDGIRNSDIQWVMSTIEYTWV